MHGMNRGRTRSGVVVMLLVSGGWVACAGAPHEVAASRPSEHPIVVAVPSAPASASALPPLLSAPLRARLDDNDPATTKVLALHDATLTSLEPLAAYRHLEDLDVSNTGVQDIATLSEMPKLTRLNLANTEVDDISVLSTLTRLEWLNLQLCPKLPAHAFDTLSQLARLEYVDLLGTQLGSLAPFDGLAKLDAIAIDFTPVGNLLRFASGPSPGETPSVTERRKHAQYAQRGNAETQREYAQLEKLRARGVKVEIDCMCEDPRPAD